MKPPLSHFLRGSVFSGKSSSGRCNTSTRTDNSAWTRGCNLSSSADTMSLIQDRGISVMFEKMNFHVHIQECKFVPAASRWCSCSWVKKSLQSLCGRHCEQTASSSLQSSAQGCSILQTDCWPGCPSRQGWLWFCFWLVETHIFIIVA